MTLYVHSVDDIDFVAQYCCVFRNQEPRFPTNIGITGHVASTGEVGELLIVEKISIIN